MGRLNTIEVVEPNDLVLCTIDYGKRYRIVLNNVTLIHARSSSRRFK
jgi:hypothetical protein